MFGRSEAKCLRLVVGTKTDTQALRLRFLQGVKKHAGVSARTLFCIERHEMDSALHAIKFGR